MDQRDENDKIKNNLLLGPLVKPSFNTLVTSDGLTALFKSQQGINIKQYPPTFDSFTTNDPMPIYSSDPIIDRHDYEQWKKRFGLKDDEDIENDKTPF